MDVVDEIKKLADKTPEFNENALSQNEFFAMDSIQAVETKWLWYPYIPLGKITLLEADPGTGKTYMALSLTAVVSSGGCFYTEPGFTHREPANVIYQTAEDGVADTIKPRLESIYPKPDMHRIICIQEEKNALTLSDERIEKALKQFHPALFVIDPVQGYLGAEVDMHRANEVRPILAHIGRLAEKYECAFLFIMHMNKNSQGPALYRSLGSIDIPAIARSMLFLGKDPEDDRHKILCHEKSSLAENGESLTFTIDPAHGGILWDGTSPLSANEVLRSGMVGHKKSAVTLTDVIEQLGDLLGKDGAATLEQVETLQTAANIAKTTLYRAKTEMALQTISIGRPPHRKTWWLDPDVDKQKFKEDHTPVPEQKVIELHPQNTTLPP